ncbi:ribonuclease H-like domain-containing protein [Tanacetum coccineum]
MPPPIHFTTTSTTSIPPFRTSLPPSSTFPVLSSCTGRFHYGNGIAKNWATVLASSISLHWAVPLKQWNRHNRAIWIIDSLHKEFSMTDLGSLNYFLGISVTRDSSEMFLSQRKYATKILELAHMVGCNPSRNPIDSESKMGDVICSAETEYRGVANVVAETCWSRNVLRELHTPLSSAMLVYCDNVSAVYLSSNPVQHQRAKHIDIDIHFVRDLVAAGQETTINQTIPSQGTNISPLAPRALVFSTPPSSPLELLLPPFITTTPQMPPPIHFTTTSTTSIPPFRTSLPPLSTFVLLDQSIWMEGPPPSQPQEHTCQLVPFTWEVDSFQEQNWLEPASQDFFSFYTQFETWLQRIIDSLHKEFSMTDLGSLNYFLGISVTCDSSEMFLSQRKNATKILERAHMVDEGRVSCVANAVVETCWSRNVLRELHTPLSSATLVYCDNVMQFICLRSSCSISLSVADRIP